MNLRGVLRGGAEVGVAQFLDLGAGLLTAALTARYLGPSGLGELSLLLAIFLAANTVADLGASALLTRDTAREPQKARALLASNLELKGWILAAVSAALVAGSGFLVGFRGLLAGLPFLVFSSVNISLAASLRGIGALSPLWKAAVPAFLLQALSSYALVQRGGGVHALLVVMGAAQGLKVVVLFASFLRSTGPSGRSPVESRGIALLRAALPFAGVVALGTLYLKVDVFLLSALWGATETGFFSAAARVTEFLKLVPGAFFAVLYPEWVRRERQPATVNRATDGHVAPLWLLSGAASLGLLLGAPFVIDILYGSKLAAGSLPLRVLALAVVPAVLNSALLLQLYARSEERAVMKIVGAGLLAKVVAGVVLIPWAGAMGAALSWVVAEWMQLGLYARKAWKPSLRSLPVWAEALAFSALALVLRLALVAIYPAHYGGDPIARMLHADRLILGYQLPLFQILVAVAERLSDDPLAARVLSAVTGAFAAAGVYVLSERLASRATARLTAALFLVNPLFIVYSLMPYQEPLMIGLLAFGGAAYVSNRRLAASALFGLACFTRYESWVVVASLAALELARGRGKGLLKTVTTFGWAPLLWLLAQGGFGPPGTYVADTAWAWARLARVSYLAERILVSAPYALLFAPFGLIALWREQRVKAFLAVVGAVMAAIVVLGHDYPPGSKGVTEREAHIPLAAAVFLSGAALARAPRRPSVALLSLAAALSLVLSVRQVRARTSEPVVTASYEIASYLSSRLGPGERALVVARPIDEALIRHYLELIATRKPVEVHAAEELVLELSLPEDYQRLAVSLRRGRERLVEVGAWQGEPVTLAVVFADASDRVPAELPLKAVPEATFQKGKRASIFAIEHSPRASAPLE